MGIPKFFRYISERYPMTSQLIQENKIPEFDNLYLDFNGIIHNCSHPNDMDAHYRISEEQIFTAIFSYVDMLFGKIKPKKLFFMAVDGVAPRAKMNQQRSRRFRTAKEAQEAKEKAERNGEKLPDEKAFDSNCITPGTPFMARLSEQLRYFINKKITEDANWRDVQVVLSGHEVPGEGEHKIMEYIRLSKAQPEYNPNMRHCLYGLDADLVMLGLLSHDPHFCLLREEVKFGPARSKKKDPGLEHINFYLLHLSLLREYLNLEFHEIADALPFEYNLERVIDDFIVLAVFVGNDFLPHLPDLHIHENGLEKLFEVYKKVLSRLGGYLNESGAIDTQRLQVVLDEMKEWEREVFEKEYADLNWYKGKQTKFVNEMETARKRSKLVLTKPQKIIFDEVKEFVLSQRRKSSPDASLIMPNMFPARERKFITLLAEDLNLDVSWDEYDDEDQNLVVWRLPGTAPNENGGDSDKINGVNGDVVESENSNGDEGQWEDVESDDDNVESDEAIDRVLKKYEKAPVKEDDEDEDFDERHERGVQEKMDEWKRNYYKGKLEIDYDNPEEMYQLIYRYVEGLQWVMHYYYSGVVSWGWFYNYHFAPRISDLKGVDKMSFNFELGQPFRPFEQLMGVLPEASKEHIPLAYRDLMTDPNSTILDFYPHEFEQDLNGKKQDWEAVVKIPFIDEKRLLKAMASREHRLTDEERQRNTWGPSMKFFFDPKEPKLYPSSLPGFFPALPRCTCKMEPFDLPTLNGLHLVPGLCDGVSLGAEALAGFPSLQTLPHTAQLGYHGVNVHGTESKNKSMIVHIENIHEERKTEDIANEMVGKRAYVGWPYLQEALVVAVSDSHFKFEKVAFGDGKQQRILSNPHAYHGPEFWKRKAEGVERYYSKRLGVVTGPVDVLIHVRPLKGLKRLDTGALVKDYESADKELEQAVQLTLSEVISEDPRFLEKEPPPLHEEFPAKTKVFFLGEPAYGVAAQVSSTEETTLSVILAFFPTEKAENESFKKVVSNRVSSTYIPSFKVANIIGISGHELSKVTSSFMVLTSDNVKINLGLSLKFEAKALKVVGYSRKEGKYWEFSEKAIDLIRDYKQAYPEVFAALTGNNGDMLRATDVFHTGNADAKVKDVRSWLAAKGVRDFEAVSLFCDQLDKSTVSEICKLADEINEKRTLDSIKKAIVKGIPRQAILKPSHAKYRLHNQSFFLGDRVTMVQDTGSVPLAVKGVVVGLNSKSMDVVWDVPFMSGTTLSDRCPQYRGFTVEFNSCLNLSRPQFVMSTKPEAQNQQLPQHPPFKPRFGPHPAVQGQSFRPAGPPQMRIMTNPSRGRGAPANANGHAWSNPNAQANGSKGHPQSPVDKKNEPSSGEPSIAQSTSVSSTQKASTSPTQQHSPPKTLPTHPRGSGRGGFGPPRGHFQAGRGHVHPTGPHIHTRGGPGLGFNPAFRGLGGRGSGGFNPAFSRGRGDFHRGGFRGGRGGNIHNHPNPAPAVASS